LEKYTFVPPVVTSSKPPVVEAQQPPVVSSPKPLVTAKPSSIVKYNEVSGLYMDNENYVYDPNTSSAVAKYANGKIALLAPTDIASLKPKRVRVNAIYDSGTPTLEQVNSVLGIKKSDVQEESSTSEVDGDEEVLKPVDTVATVQAQVEQVSIPDITREQFKLVIDAQKGLVAPDIDQIVTQTKLDRDIVDKILNTYGELLRKFGNVVAVQPRSFGFKPQPKMQGKGGFVPRRPPI
jgi:hypothetical protein